MTNAKIIIAFALAAILAFSFGCTTQPPAQIVGNDSDAHGCIASAGYTWCEPLQQCIRPWETNCTLDAAGTDDDMMPGTQTGRGTSIYCIGQRHCPGNHDARQSARLARGMASHSGVFVRGVF